MNTSFVDLNALFSGSSKSPALCIGSGATVLPGVYMQTREKALSELFRISPTLAAKEIHGFDSMMDWLVLEAPETAEVLRGLYVDELRKQQPSLDIKNLAEASWSACVSISEDMVFETSVRNYFDRKPQSLSLTIVDSPNQPIPARTVPVYKLLGNMESKGVEARLALSTSERLIREQAWANLLRTAADFCRDAPLLFVGVHTNLELTRRLMSLLASQPRPSFSKIYFLKQDSPLADPTVSALSKAFDVRLVDATVRDVCEAVKTPRGVAAKLAVVPTGAVPSVKVAISKLSGLVSVVPADSPADINHAKTHMPQLVDALFRPASIDWQPYQYGLDLRRELTGPLVEAIRNQGLTQGASSIVIRGDAATGKTTLMKRVAIEVAQAGTLTLWCRRSLLGSWSRAFREFCREVAAIPEASRKNLKIAVFCDDPWQVRIDAAELLRCFESCPCPVAVIFAVRNSDFYSSPFGESPLGIKPREEHELSFELTVAELGFLEKLLVRLGAAASDQDAKKLVGDVRSQNVRDILCSLWYLVPETRFQLSESLRDEYCRLGESNWAVGRIASSASENMVARRAYEFVTVTTSLGLGLPIEVLVRSLGIQYDEWLAMSENGRPLWGLLYDDKDADDRTIVFWTRNEIVTRVLLDLVNGGIPTHVGEMRILRELLASCGVGSIVYREFVVDVLVRARAKLELRLSYEQGMELFDTAIAALPYSDRAIEHHKGIWIQNKGDSSLLPSAYAQLSRALDAPTYPGSEREARREHIHTSLAATVLDMVKEGRMAIDEAIGLIQDHARQASNPSFFNPHSAHVVASLFFELAKRATAGQESVAAIAISDALSEIDRAAQYIGTSARSRAHYDKDVLMLGDLQRRVIQLVPDGEELRRWAAEIFAKTGQQVGFEAASRRLVDDAVNSDKGTAFNLARLYLDEVEQVLLAAGKVATPELRCVRADLEIQWRLQRVAGAIKWQQLLDDLEVVLGAPRFKDDPIRHFYRAVCLFQIGRYGDANAIFSTLRRQALNAMLPAEARCAYRGSEGMARRFQGVLEQRHGNYYLFIQELGVSVLSRRPERDGGPGATIHGYVVFSLNGPLAVYYRPEH